MKFVPNKISRNVGRKVLTMKKNSPHIFFAAGVVGAVGSTVLACRATLKLEKTLDEIHTDFDQVKEMKTLIDEPTSEYTEKEYLHDLGYVYGKSGSKLVRLYAPSVALGALSIAALTGSHIQLSRRNTALSASLALISKAFDDYRVRMQQEIGEDRELDIYRGIVEEEIGTDGKKKVVSRVVDPSAGSIYAKLFDEANPNWQKNAEYNRTFLQIQQNHWNLKLRERGYVFLNEVYDALGFEYSHIGQLVGWMYEPDPDGTGDGYIDFSLYDANNRDFLEGFERSIWLDFNVDGVIYEKF